MVVTADGNEDSGRGFIRAYRDYAATYGTSIRTVKRWVADGRKKGDEPPLDRPAEMVAWWERNMSHRVPAEILTAAGGDALMEIPPVKAKTPPPPPVIPVAEPVETKALPDIPAEQGLEHALAAVEELEAKLRAENADAGKTKLYLDTVNRLTILSGRLREEAEKTKRLLPRDIVETVIHEFHGPIEREIRLLYRTMCEKLGLPESPAREEEWNRELDRIFARLGETILRAA